MANTTNVGYLWDEPNAGANKFVYDLSHGRNSYTNDQLMNLTVTGVLGKKSGSATRQAELDKAGTQTVGEWLKGEGKALSDNPFQNAITLREFASAQGLAAGGKQNIDQYGRPLVWGRTGQISYTGDPNDPATWKVAVTDGGKPVDATFDTKTGILNIPSYGGIPAATSSYAQYQKATGGKWVPGQTDSTGDTSGNDSGLPGGMSNYPTNYGNATPPVTPSAASGMSGGRLSGPRGQSLADYMASQGPATGTTAPTQSGPPTPIPGVNLPQDTSWAQRVMQAGGIQNNMGLNQALGGTSGPATGTVPPGTLPTQPTFPPPPPTTGITEPMYPPPPPATNPSAGTTPRLSLNQALSGGQNSELAPPGAPSPLGQQTGGK